MSLIKVALNSQIPNALDYSSEIGINSFFLGMDDLFYNLDSSLKSQVNYFSIKTILTILENILEIGNKLQGSYFAYFSVYTDMVCGSRL